LTRVRAELGGGDHRTHVAVFLTGSTLLRMDFTRRSLVCPPADATFIRRVSGSGTAFHCAIDGQVETTAAGLTATPRVEKIDPIHRIVRTDDSDADDAPVSGARS
jgi:hypothetical protein